MSSLAKRMGKRLTNTLRFDPEMYSNIFGSYIVCTYILNGGDIAHIKRTWKKVLREPTKYIDISKENWLEEFCTLFKVKYDLSGRIAYCEGKLNSLFCLVDNEGILHTTREDGYVFRSMTEAANSKRVKVLVEEVEEK